MANTFLDLQTRVQRRLIDVRAEVTAEIPMLINEGVDALQAIHNFRCMQAELQFTTNHSASDPHVIGQIPMNSSTTWAWKEPRGNPYYVLQIGDTRELVWIPNRTFAYRQWSAFNTFSIGPPRMLLIGEPSNTTVPDPSNQDLLMNNLNVEVFPAPDGMSDWNTAPGGEYRINVPYWGYQPPMTADADQNWFTLNANSFLIDFATCRGFQLDWDEARAALWYRSAWGEKFDGSNLSTVGGWARVTLNRDRSIAFAPGRTLIPRRDVYAPRDQWRT